MSQSKASAPSTISDAVASLFGSELDADQDFTVENSPLARLMSMLDYPVLKNNPNLMDKMFTCLSYASAGIPQLESLKAQSATITPPATTASATPASVTPVLVPVVGEESTFTLTMVNVKLY